MQTSLYAKCPDCGNDCQLRLNLTYMCRKCKISFHWCRDDYSVVLTSPFTCGLCDCVDFKLLYKIQYHTHYLDLFTPTCTCGCPISRDVLNKPVQCDRCHKITNKHDLGL